MLRRDCHPAVLEKFQLKRTGLAGHTWDAESP
jgi:hypothetical protein